MADVDWTRSPSSRDRASALAFPAITGTALANTINGNWIGPCDSWEPTGLAVLYDETGGGSLSQVVLSLDVKVAGLSLAWKVSNAGTVGSWGATVTATGNYYFSVNVPGQTAGGALRLYGMDEIRVTAAFTGAGATTAAFTVYMIGRQV